MWSCNTRDSPITRMRKCHEWTLSGSWSVCISIAFWLSHFPVVRAGWWVLFFIWSSLFCVPFSYHHSVDSLSDAIRAEAYHACDCKMKAWNSVFDPHKFFLFFADFGSIQKTDVLHIFACTPVSSGKDESSAADLLRNHQNGPHWSNFRGSGPWSSHQGTRIWFTWQRAHSLAAW